MRWYSVPQHAFHTSQLHQIFRTTIAILFVVGVLSLPRSASPEIDPASQCIPLSFADIAERIQSAVVNISTSQTFRAVVNQDAPSFDDKSFEWYFDGTVPQPGFKRRSLGSGVIIDPAGYIITNNHVIEGADEIRITLSDEEEFAAEIIGRDVKTDVALIKITANERTFPVAQIGDSDNLRVGEWVIAVGNPYGLSHTVTAGIVSAKGRVIGGPYDDFIQTDASINPGNSGGPLINIHGEVIGINTAIFANIQGEHFAQGIGFAIPVNIVSHVAHDLRRYGKVQRGWLGVMIQEITPDLADSFNLTDERGALIANVVPGGPADKGGLKRGDIVLQFNDTKINESVDLPRITADMPPGTSSVLTVNRDGEEVTLPVTLGEFPESTAFMSQNSSFREESLGIDVQDITPDLIQRFKLSTDATGVVVVDVTPDSPADRAQILPGDILTEINQIELQNLEEYYQALEISQSDQMLLVLLKRGENMLYVIIKVE